MPIDKSQIARMSRAEKMEMMEALWADLSTPDDDVASPKWHEEELRATEARLAKGQETLVEWEDAKRDLRKRFD